MALVHIIGYTAAFLTTVASIPQLVKAWKTKKTRDISLLYFGFLLVGVGLWLAYGVLLRNGPIIIANTVTFILLLGVLVAKLKYG